MVNPLPNQNPYAANVLPPAMPIQTQMPGRSVPVFCTIMFIISLICSGLRLLVVPLSVIGYFTIRQEDPGSPVLITIPFEILSGIGIALFGILANSLLLAKKEFGLILAYILVLSVLVNLATAVWQSQYLLMEFTPGSDEYIGAIIGLAMVMIFRLMLLCAYLVALVMFKNWIRNRFAA